MAQNDLALACQTTIESLHRFFVAWFRGTCDDSDAVWATFEKAMVRDFVLIAPGGQVLPHESLVLALRAHYGQHRERRFEIEVRNVTLQHVTANVVVAGYEEWQWLEDRQTARISTAVFGREPAESMDLRWIRVHETWLPGKSP